MKSNQSVYGFDLISLETVGEEKERWMNGSVISNFKPKQTNVLKQKIKNKLNFNQNYIIHRFY